MSVLSHAWVAAPLLVLGACLVEIRTPVEAGPGGMGGAAGGTTTDGGGGAGGTAGSPPCPEDMVHATDGAAVSFCIDKTEVTRARYLGFLSSVGGTLPPAEQHPSCAGNVELTNPEDGTCNFATATELPVNCVDWCDAHAFCKWDDKRLCGALGGGGLDFDDEPVLGEWHFACTGGLQTAYPYGDDADPAACNIPESSERAEVASFPGCEGGFPDMFDMQGNVAEWIDACVDGAPDAMCKARGGHTFGSATYWRCNNSVEGEPRTEASRREFGFRCCRDAD